MTSIISKLKIYLMLIEVSKVLSITIDEVDCGIDKNNEVMIGDIDVEVYPWLGVLYYTDEMMNGVRSVTPVALIQAEFVVASAAEIGEIPKRHFRVNTRVLLGQRWDGKALRVSDYVMHPQYGETLNTVALIHLKSPIRDGSVIPICPPPEILTDPEFFVVRFKEDYSELKKEVMSMYYVPARLCRDFYVAANLYAKKMRPPHVVCASAVEDNNVCVWESGSALVTKDVWGRWQLLGFGVRGPGCGGPSRYLDMLSYYPWIKESIHRFTRVSISMINKHKYVLRSNDGVSRFGDCDREEQKNILYRDFIKLVSDNAQYQFMTYNLSIMEMLEVSCLTMELQNATSTAEMRVRHYCPRKAFGPACYSFDRSLLDLSIFIMFADACRFEIIIWGEQRNMSLLDIMEWKWEEGTYYEDFNMSRSEYRGNYFMTGYGFEPIDPNLWIPNYDVWSSTEYNETTSATTPPPTKNVDDPSAKKGKGWKSWIPTIPKIPYVPFVG